MARKDFTPPVVHRRGPFARVRRYQICTDDRNYTPYDFTLIGPGNQVVAADYEPMKRVHRDSYVAKISATVGRHDSATHPNDGCPTGSALTLNVRRVTSDLSGDAAVLSSDSIISIAAGAHKDTASGDETDFNILKINAGEYLYIRVVSVGSTNPGGIVVVSVDLVPFRGGLGGFGS